MHDSLVASAGCLADDARCYILLLKSGLGTLPPARRGEFYTLAVSFKRERECISAAQRVFG